MKGNQQNINFKDYYDNLKNIQGELREKICTILNISEKTFYNLKERGFSYPQQVVIARELEIPVEQLFPQKKERKRTNINHVRNLSKQQQ